MKKHIKARRERNLELGKRDAANRCPLCRRALPGVTERWYSALDERPYCSEECVDTAHERAKEVPL